MFGLRQSDIDIITSLGEQNPAIEAILIYGSRVRDDYRRGSDVDLALVGELIWSDVLYFLRVLNEELPTPYFYDVLHLDTLSNEALKEHIKIEGKIVYERT
jgi:predicted nucleotidyltransferase